MRVIVLSVAALSVSLVHCDLLKKAQGTTDDSGVTATSATAATATAATTGATAEPTADPSKGATSGCAWPANGDHDVTITKGCAVNANHEVTLREGATMTIEEGVKISFETDQYLWVDYGKLVVKGTEASPVTFTSANKSPAAGDWVGIGFQEKTMAGSSIDHLIVEYSGSKAAGGVGGIHVERMRQGGRVAITNSIVRTGAQFGLVADENATFSKFENNSFRDNKSGSLNVEAEVLGSVGKGNTFTQTIHVKQSTIDQTTTWPPFDVPVQVDGNLEIKSDSSIPTFTIADKTIVKMGQDTYIAVGDNGSGVLIAKNVTFTSASPTPAPGDWGSIFIYSKSSGTTLDGCTIEYFGSSAGSANGGLTLWGTSAKDLKSVTITNNTFQKGKQTVMHSNDGVCAPYDKTNKAIGVPFCNKP